MRIYWQRIAVLVGVIIAGFSPSFAQKPVPNSPATRKTLETVLKAVRWNPDKRGVLLAIWDAAPHQVLRASPDSEEGGISFKYVLEAHEPEVDGNHLKELESSKTPNGYEVSSIAEAFGRMAHHFGGVTVLAPKTMTLLTEHPERTIPSHTANERLRVERLLVTLTPAQWQLIGSPTGIGMGDPTGAQQHIYDAILEEPFVIARTPPSKYNGSDRYAQRSFYDKVPQRTLTSEERQAVRLRIKLKSWVDGISRQNSHITLNLLMNHDQNDATKPTLHNVSKARQGNNYYEGLSQEVENHLKKGDLNFDALTITVPLEATPEKPLTVALLIERIGRANQIDLRCDPRFGEQTVWIRGTSARSDDLLKSLCLGLSSTIRKVGTIYLLTSDLLGSGVQRATLNDYTLNAPSEFGTPKENYRIANQMRKSNALQYLHFDSNDPIKPSSAMIHQMTVQKDERDTVLGIEVKASELSSEARAYLSERLSKPSLMVPKPQRLRNDLFRLQVIGWAGYLLPGLGEIEGDMVVFPEVFAPKDPPKLLSASGKIVLLNPTSSKETDIAVEELSKRGATGVWIQTTLTPGGREILTSAISAGQRFKLPITAVARVLRQSTTNAPTELLDQNLRGETAGWLEPDLPETAMLLKTGLSDLVKIPGLAGVVLEDLLPPGYRGRTVPGGDASYFVAGAFDQQGYRLSHRVEFLKATGTDPVDIVPYPSRSLPIPGVELSRGENSVAGAWAAWRNDRALPLLTALRVTMEEAHPGFPIWVQCARVPETIADYDDRWYVPWNSDAPCPTLYRSDISLKTPLVPQARRKAKQLLLNLFGETQNQYAVPPDPTGADGTVIDLSADSVKDALEQLEKPKGIAQGNNP